MSTAIAEMVALKRAQLKRLQQAFPRFNPFLKVIMAELGHPVSPVQYDIAEFLETGPDYLMIQAQRGQAKTTITAAFAIWYLIHNPKGRILIVSADGSGANDITSMIAKLINTLDFLECMRPDRSAGDRTSTEKFDIHHALKGINKSASVMCLGITGTMQGKRADLLIADDIESTKNSMTAAMREMILHRSRDFTSQVINGRIVYLGTPQSSDSIYNTLPGRGFTVRIWPGRYPTPEQRDKYGDMLAPIIADALDANPELGTGGGLNGDDGQPIDPSYITEEVLQDKERDQGRSLFMLNHMLDTSLSDALRYPLKLSSCILGLGMTVTRLPMVVEPSMDGAAWPKTAGSMSFVIGRGTFSSDVAPAVGVCMYIDPAGGGKNGDETGFAATAMLNGNVYLLGVGGVPGGYERDKLEKLADYVAEIKPTVLIIEKNMGYGAFKEVFLPVLARKYQCEVKEDYVTGHKERRICDTLEPVIGRGSLVITERAIDMDVECCEVHIPQKRKIYSLFHQIDKITRDTGALTHDDRLDALEGSVRYWQNAIAIDQKAAMEAQVEEELREFMRNPIQRPGYDDQPNSFISQSLLDHF